MPAFNNHKFTAEEIERIQSENSKVVGEANENFWNLNMHVRYNAFIKDPKVRVQVPIITVIFDSGKTITYMAAHAYDGYNNCDAVKHPYFSVLDTTCNGDPEEYEDKYASLDAAIHNALAD